MRCFIALSLSEIAREAIWEHSRPLRELWPRGSWVRPEGYHLTLSFLGEIGSRGLTAARRALTALEESASLSRELSFIPQALNTFPKGSSRWRVLVVEPDLSTASSASKLHELLCTSLAEASEAGGLPPLDPEWPDAATPGSRPRRPFAAHLTLARARRGEAPPRLDLDLLSRVNAAILRASGGGWSLGALVLYKSELRPGGALYTELERIRLPLASPFDPISAEY